MLGTTLATIPADVPYLKADDSLVAVWRERMSIYSGIKVGIAWQGSTTHREDRYRSIPLARFAPLAETPGVRLLSLQKGHGLEQIKTLGGQFEVVDLLGGVDEPDGGLMNAAAILQNVDLVIACDTAIVHLAGALGRPVWVALPTGPDWRWLMERRDSPWYPSMRLFRQRVLGDWTSVFDEMAQALQSGTLPTAASRMKS